MDFFDNPYHRNVRLLLTVVGQWPYDTGNLKYLSRFVISTLIVTFVLAEVFKIITTMGQFDVVLQMIPFFLFPVVSGIKYYTCWIKSTLIKRILEFVKNDWNTLQSEAEVEIMKKYAAEGWFYGKIYVVYIFSVTGGFVTMLFVPFVLDAIVPANFSRADMLPFEAEYFIDMEGRYYYVILHVQTTAVAGVAGIAAADIFYIAVIFHTCGLHTITSYRLEHIFDDIRDIDTARKVAVVRAKVRNAMEFHLKCLNYLKVGMSIYAVSFVLQLFVIVLVIAGLLFNVYLLLMSGQPLLAFAFLLDLMGHYFLLFLNIIPGQRLIESSEELHFSTYNGRWYEAPLRAQKFLLVIMQKTQKPYILSAAGIFEMSVETLSKIIRISFSYFMIIRSTQD